MWPPHSLRLMLWINYSVYTTLLLVILPRYRNSTLYMNVFSVWRCPNCVGLMLTEACLSLPCSAITRLGQGNGEFVGKDKSNNTSWAFGQRSQQGQSLYLLLFRHEVKWLQSKCLAQAQTDYSCVEALSLCVRMPVHQTAFACVSVCLCGCDQGKALFCYGLVFEPITFTVLMFHFNGPSAF